MSKILREAKMKTLYGMDFSDEAYVKLVLKSMVISFIFYSIIYKILRKVVGVSPEYNCRIITFVHGLISCFSAVSYVVLPSLGYYKGESCQKTSRHILKTRQPRTFNKVRVR